MMKKRLSVQFLHSKDGFVQDFGQFLRKFADFRVVFRFCKHASEEKVNAKFFCGVDFFQPSKGF